MVKKIKLGRPTSFKPEFCDKVIDLMKEGASIVEIAYELNVNRSEDNKIYPFVTKNGTLDSFKTISTNNFNSFAYGLF